MAGLRGGAGPPRNSLAVVVVVVPVWPVGTALTGTASDPLLVLPVDVVVELLSVSLWPHLRLRGHGPLLARRRRRRARGGRGRRLLEALQLRVGPEGLPRVRLTRGVEWFRRVCGPVDCLKLDRGELAEASLPSAAVVGPSDPGHHCQAQILAGLPALPVQHVALQQGEERFHRGVVAAGADSAHRAGQTVASQRFDELLRPELGEFNRSLQHRAVVVNVAARRRPRPGSSSQGSCELDGRPVMADGGYRATRR